MNSKQRYMLFSAVAVIVLMGLFPPWQYISHLKVSEHVGYYALWSPPPKHAVSRRGHSVNSGQLAVQWLCVSLVTGALWLALKDREIGKEN